MKYIVFTAKHHDGFAMFDTKVNDWSIVKQTPFERDPLKELADACRKEGIKLGFFYSQAQDWMNGGSTWYDKRWDKTQEHDMDDYIEKTAIPQVRELLTNYGPDIPAIIWWDTPMGMNRARAEKLANAVREITPGIIMNNRLGGGVQGDIDTPERRIPASGTIVGDWETCMPINDTWGYKRDDENWKSAAVLIRFLVDCASKGGNFLLNVGPTDEGIIPQPSVDRLAEIGRWMKVNGESIWGATPAQLPPVSWGRYTRKGQTLYLHVFDWPADKTLKLPVSGKIQKIHLLNAPNNELPFQTDPQGFSITLPTAAPDAADSVIAVQMGVHESHGCSSAVTSVE